MHELGHNLGLGHGGLDGINNKPNYVGIIINYNWQVTGLSYDFDGDGLGIMSASPSTASSIPDPRRFQYSTLADLPVPATLNEGVPPLRPQRDGPPCTNWAASS